MGLELHAMQRIQNSIFELPTLFIRGSGGNLNLSIAACVGESGGCFITPRMGKWLIFQALGPMSVKLIRL
jgi:hypothetical protein